MLKLKEKKQKYHCGYRKDCPFYEHMSSLYKHTVCDSMATVRIMRENRCERVTTEHSKLEKLINRVEELSREVNGMKSQIKDCFKKFKN